MLEGLNVEVRFSHPGFSDQVNCLPLVEKNSPEIIIKLLLLRSFEFP